MRFCKEAIGALGLAAALVMPTAHAQLFGGLQSTVGGLLGTTQDTLGEVLNAGAPNTIEGQYIVVLEEDAGPVASVAQQLLATVGGQYLGELPIINAAVVRVDALSARILAANPLVDYVEQDQVMQAVATSEQTPATWGLDRSDERQRQLDNRYRYPSDGGAGTHLYIIDTGLRVTHDEFAGRVGGGRNFAGSGGLGLPIPLLGPVLGGLLGGGGDIDPEDFSDCNGHGTHVAGTAAGATYGIAKQATVYGVRVLGCDGGGANSGVIAGVDWVAENAQMPAVANMSLGGGASTALDDAVRNAVDAGVVMVVAAGNSDADACGGSPNRVAEAVTVGSTTSNDDRSSFSNRGSCVDLFAPGSNITSAWYESDTQTNTISGTSMASPHVAGAAALLLDEGNGDPQTVFNLLLSDATPDVLDGIGSGSPNRLLYVRPE